MSKNIKPVWPTFVSASSRGFSHARNGTCCQDAVAVRTGYFRAEPYWIFSSGDGHGHPAYVHSDQGSVLANLSAEQTAVQFLLSGLHNEDDRDEHFAEFFRNHLKEEWIRNIRQSRQAYRMTDEEISTYGSTLLIAMIYRDTLYLAQLGDGDIVIVDHGGKASFLVEPETGPVSPGTASLCSSNANERWAFACLPMKDVAFLMMSTDGLINSLTGPKAHVKLVKQFQNHLLNLPTPDIQQALPQWLAEYSEAGSGDDISLVAIAMTSINKQTKEKGKENETTTKNTRTNHREEIGRGRSGDGVHCPEEREETCPEDVQ